MPKRRVHYIPWELRQKKRRIKTKTAKTAERKRKRCVDDFVTPACKAKRLGDGSWKTAPAAANGEEVGVRNSDRRKPDPPGKTDHLHDGCRKVVLAAANISAAVKPNPPSNNLDGTWRHVSPPGHNSSCQVPTPHPPSAAESSLTHPIEEESCSSEGIVMTKASMLHPHDEDIFVSHGDAVSWSPVPSEAESLDDASIEQLALDLTVLDSEESCEMDWLPGSLGRPVAPPPKSRSLTDKANTRIEEDGNVCSQEEANKAGQNAGRVGANLGRVEPAEEVSRGELVIDEEEADENEDVCYRSSVGMREMPQQSAAGSLAMDVEMIAELPPSRTGCKIPSSTCCISNGIIPRIGDFKCKRMHLSAANEDNKGKMSFAEYMNQGEVFVAEVKAKDFSKKGFKCPAVPKHCEFNGQTYELLASKLVDNGRTKWGSKIESARFFYVPTDGPGSLQRTLDQIADFKSLPKNKAKARLELLVTEGTVQEVPTNDVEVVDGPGTAGCGFIPKDMVLKLVGVKKTVTGKRTNVVQIRLIAPKFGLNKGTLRVKLGIEKIQVPRSMLKAGPSKHGSDDWACIVIKNRFPSENNRKTGNALANKKLPRNFPKT